MTLRIYHNPRCSKSRQTLQLLRDRGLDPEVVEYLKHPPSAVVLDGLLRAMGMLPRDLMRHKEAPLQAAEPGRSGTDPRRTGHGDDR